MKYCMTRYVDRLCGLVIGVPGYRSGFDCRHYQSFWEIVGLERGPLRLVSTTEELIGRKSRGSGLESREYGRRDRSRWPRGTLYTQNFALTSTTSGSRSVGIVRSRTQAKDFTFISFFHSLRLTNIKRQHVCNVCFYCFSVLYFLTMFNTFSTQSVKGCKYA
jgi:hypothetical protein